MPPRANWKGYLRLSLFAAMVAFAFFTTDSSSS
jgi:non-homologous end joining protein Ku